MNYLKAEVKRLDKKIRQAQASLNDPQLKSLAQQEIKQLQQQKKYMTPRGVTTERMTLRGVITNSII